MSAPSLQAVLHKSKSDLQKAKQEGKYIYFDELQFVSDVLENLQKLRCKTADDVNIDLDTLRRLEQLAVKDE